jgi:GTP cyclohydrolase II/3,4-dihydroxy 2-butanone 4-phosphate synthase/GTP cyclohydrolase II
MSAKPSLSMPTASMTSASTPSTTNLKPQRLSAVVSGLASASHSAPLHATTPMHDDDDASFSRYSEANIPTEYGEFRVVCYRERVLSPLEGVASFKEHLAIAKGDVRGHDEVPVRVHSECLTGEVLHSLKCDCREQLDHALKRIASEERGVVLYLRQEGRGIGLGNKLRAYALQEKGVDTVDANRLLGLPDDSRNFDVAAFMLADLGARSIVLLTNNPLKVKSLRAEGVHVVRREPVRIEPNAHNVEYLRTKGKRMGHELMGHPLDEAKVPTDPAAPNDAVDARSEPVLLPLGARRPR